MQQPGPAGHPEHCQLPIADLFAVDEKVFSIGNRQSQIGNTRYELSGNKAIIVAVPR
jgi:hypothetical protein